MKKITNFFEVLRILKYLLTCIYYSLNIHYYLYIVNIFLLCFYFTDNKSQKYICLCKNLNEK